MARNERTRIYLGPEALKLAVKNEGDKAEKELLEKNLTELQTRLQIVTHERDTGVEQLEFLKDQSAQMAGGLEALRDLADAAVYRNKIEVEVAKVFESHFDALHKRFLHVTGLIGLNSVDEEEREVLLKQMTRNVAEVLAGLDQRSDTARERSHDNVQTTKKIAKEVNDTRAAVQATNNQELDLVLGEDGGMER